MNEGHNEGLHQEGIPCEGIEVHLDPSNVADDLEEQAEEHANGETPCSVEDAEAYLGNDKDSKYGEEDGIAG